MVAGFQPRNCPLGRLHLLDVTNSAQIIHYEQSLYENFYSLQDQNPLIRNLWNWDHREKRLRTKIPYEGQAVVVLSDSEQGSIKFSTGVNLQLERFWQSGSFGFDLPEDAKNACEFMIMARGFGNFHSGISLTRYYVKSYLFQGLAASGYRVVYSTTADPLIPLYHWLGGKTIGEKMIEGHRRTLIRWELQA